MNIENSIVLVDANNLTLRSMYGCAALYDYQGFPTGCLMTSVRTICRIAGFVKPYRVICVWDGGHSKFRKQIFPEYKQRAKLDEDKDEEKINTISEWKEQVKMMQEYLPMLGIGNIKIGGCEADDLIFKLRGEFREAGINTVIASSDADFFQLIADDTYIYHLSREKIYDLKMMHQEYGVVPSQWSDYRAMTGDGSDNIKGIDGIGPKRASAILQEFTSLNKFFSIASEDWIAQSGKKFYKQLFEGHEIIQRNKKLMDFEWIPEEAVPSSGLQQQLDIALEHKYNRDAFWKICIKHQLNTLLEESYLWRSCRKE